MNLSLWRGVLRGGALMVLSILMASADAATGDTLPLRASWPSPACILSAGRSVNVSPWVILSVMETEGGRPGQVARDSNGSADLGPMQINTLWLPRLAPLGITRRVLANDGCLNVKVGAAILALMLHDADGNLATAVGWYHSHTQTLAQSYRARVLASLTSLDRSTAAGNR